MKRGVQEKGGSGPRYPPPPSGHAYDQVLTTWSEGRQNGLVLNLRLCDITALQACKSDINIQ